MLSFALKNLAVKKARMLLVALSVIISAAVALLSYNVSCQINDGIRNTFIYYDMILGPAGSSTQLAMNTLFFTDKPLGTISYDYVSELENSGLINQAVPFCMGDSFNSSRIVGTTPALLEGKALKEGEMFSVDALYGAVLGSSVASRYKLNVGDSIVTSHGLGTHGTEHSASPLKIVGILKTTHTNYDNTIFTSYKTVWAVHAGEEEEEEAVQVETNAASALPSHGRGSLVNMSASSANTEEEIEAHEGSVCAVIVKTKSAGAFYQLQGRYAKDAGLLVINPSTVLWDVLSSVDTSTEIVYILCLIILIMNILVVSVITLLNLFSSKEEIALMRLIGISMKKIRCLYLIQNSILGLASTVLALLVSHASLGLINGYTSSMGVVMNPLRLYPAEALIALGVFAISVLPTLICIWFMSRRDTIRG